MIPASRVRLFGKCGEGWESKGCHQLWLYFVICGMALASTAIGYGQATGSFSGNVVDKSGSGIPGATVTVTSQDTGLTRG
jgi:hypothetical protein